MNNIELIKKYPFLEVNEGQTDITWLNLIPSGWRDICIQMCDELLNALGEYVYEFRISEMKEKFGGLRVYYLPFSGDYDVIDAVLKKYEEISRKTCVWCGDTATRDKEGYYALPCCDKHFW